MSLEAFIDIRFCDPIISLALNSSGLVYGSMMGRLLYYHFSTRAESVINELSDECICGTYLSQTNTLYACIGDLKALIITNPDSKNLSKQYITFEMAHSSVSCELSQIKMHEDTVFIGFLEPLCKSESVPNVLPPAFLVELTIRKQNMIEGPKFPQQSVFFDFDGKRLLWMESEAGIRRLKIYYIRKSGTEIKVMNERFGKVGFCKMIGERVVYVHRQRVIKIFMSNGKDLEIGRHRSYVIALCAFKITERKRTKRLSRISGDTNYDETIENIGNEEEVRSFVISADMEGCIKIWDTEKLVEEIFIKNLPQLTKTYQKMQYFSMGFPYYIATYGPRLAISTDLGVLVIRSKILEQEFH